MTKPKPKPAAKAAAPKKGMNTGKKPAPPASPPAEPAAIFLEPPKKAKPAAPRPLTPMQRRFAEEYLIDLNGTKAAERAGYSPKTAAEQATRLLTNVQVRAHIDAGMAERTERTKITADMVLRELGRIGFSDIRKAVTWTATGVKLRPSDEIDDDTAAGVAEVKETVTQGGGSIGLKKHDKVKALELIGKHLGMFIDKTELTGKNGKPLIPGNTHATGVLLVPGVMSMEDWVKMAEDPEPGAAPAKKGKA